MLCFRFRNRHIHIVIPSNSAHNLTWKSGHCSCAWWLERSAGSNLHCSSKKVICEGREHTGDRDAATSCKPWNASDCQNQAPASEGAQLYKHLHKGEGINFWCLTRLQHGSHSPEWIRHLRTLGHTLL